jgi:hypothetical protein
MVRGSNTNVRYRGRTFHVQTEDSGLDNPHIITLLYEGGAILYSRKQSYEESLGQPDLEQQVRERIEQQHREVVQGLKSGQHDALLGLEAKAESTQPGLPKVEETKPEIAVPARAAGPAGQRAADPERPCEFGAGTLTERPLDEVIAAHLSP